jgi:ATP-dependent exoDNAse (exonuclease V) beta subunit
LLEHEAEEAARERAEGIRVAYVAATRARDLLVAPVVGDEMYPTEGWLSPLYKALYPTQANWRKSRPAEGCPSFGASSVIERPMDYDRLPEFSVRPGLIEPAAGRHQVVWWDPSKLSLGEDADRKHDELLRRVLADDGGQSLSAYRAWQTERAATIFSAAKPEFEVFLASQSTDAPPEATAVEYIVVDRSAREGGRRFGTLVHAVIGQTPLDAGPEEIARWAALNGRILGSPAGEIDAAREAVEAALKHPLIARARAAERCHREYPVTLKLDGGRLLEGIIDLAFVEQGAWVVVDFKTDAEVADHRARYQRQLQWYVHALARLTGMEGRGILLGV